MFGQKNELAEKVTYFSFAMGKFSGDYNKLELVTEGDAKVKFLTSGKIVDVSPLTSKNIEKYFDKLFATGIMEWQEEYIDSSIKDGIQWNIEIHFKDGTTREIYGSNKYPETWKKFIKCVNSLDVPDIK